MLGNPNSLCNALGQTLSYHIALLYKHEYGLACRLHNKDECQIPCDLSLLKNVVKNYKMVQRRSF